MVEGVLPVTRFSSAALLLGCWMLTCAWAPIEKPCQLTTALGVDCVMASLLPDAAPMVTPPAATLPPVGSVPGATCASAR